MTKQQCLELIIKAYPLIKCLDRRPELTAQLYVWFSFVEEYKDIKYDEWNLRLTIIKESIENLG